MRNRWNREGIIRHLVERDAKRLSMTVGTGGIDLRLYEAARRIFGSWRNAIQAAGIAPSRVLTWERWPPGKILLMIQHLSRRGRPLTIEQLEQRFSNLVNAARRHFGSWSKAALAAGVDPSKLRKVVPWTSQRVIEAILTRALRNESLAARLVRPRSLVAAGQRLFGSWAAAVKAAGLDASLLELAQKCNGRSCSSKLQTSPPASQQRERWSKERVIAALQARHEEQKPMQCCAIASDNPGLCRAIRHHLQNWSQAMRAAGLDPDAYSHSGRPTPLKPPAGASQANDTQRLDHPG